MQPVTQPGLGFAPALPRRPDAPPRTPDPAEGAVAESAASRARGAKEEPWRMKLAKLGAGFRELAGLRGAR